MNNKIATDLKKVESSMQKDDDDPCKNPLVAELIKRQLDCK
tara:strand:- start:1009 stop:1131 length:123 start_codon:yes stop_codon:yes gene_type:complete